MDGLPTRAGGGACKRMAMAHNTFLFVQARPSPREAGEDFHVRPGLERSADRSGGWQALAGLQLLHPEALAARSAPLAAFPHKSMLLGWLPGLALNSCSSLFYVAACLCVGGREKKNTGGLPLGFKSKLCSTDCWSSFSK